MRVLNGSHSAKIWRALTSPPSRSEQLGPVGHLVVLDLAAAVVRDGDVGRPVDDDVAALLCPSTALTLWNRMTPSFLASSWDCSRPPMAMPPMWKVRMVSWVPGSPMDWAATMPTASPSSTR